jgi:GNAT superfamily N-acetyltransferase
MHMFTYHKAGPEDIQTLVHYRILFALELTGEQPHEAIESLRNQMTIYFAKATADESCISFMAMCNGEVAGIGSVQFREQPGNFKNPSGKWGYIMNMYTVPEFRRRGISTKILELLLKEGRNKGVTAFELHATRAGEPVYQKNGFEVHKEPTYRKFSR